MKREDFRKKNRRSFLIAGASAVAGFFGLRWILTAENADGISWPLRRGFEFNERVTSAVLPRAGENSPRSTPAPGTPPRINGGVGLDEPVELPWSLAFEGAGGVKKSFTLEDLKAMPVVSLAAEFRCIEGWSRAVTYEGVRFSDFLAAASAGAAAAFVGLETPDEEYYVGIDMESMMHPQTVLAWAMNGAALAAGNGAPLRLMIPVKYGIKSLKRVGRIFLSEERPADYWAEQGYDWHSGH